MSVQRSELQDYLSSLLKVGSFSDYCPNGLQVEGQPLIERLVTGVTASAELIEQAIAHNAQGLLVHHGYFWKGEAATLTGVKKQRIARLLQHEINLFAYHLPLDCHPQLGNNAQLAAAMGWQISGELPGSIGLMGETSASQSGEALRQQLAAVLDFAVLHIAGADRPIKRVAWCTGAAQGDLQQAIAAGADAYISGEISEPTVHLARESGVHYYAAGHHATERGGVRAVGEHLAERFALDVQFIDLPIPV